MIKIMFILGVMACSTSTGWYIRKIMIERNLYFHDLVKFCNQLQQNIQSKKERIGVFVEKNKQSYHASFARDIEKVFLTHESIQFEYLKNREKKEIEDFFNGLGSLTMKEEIDNIRSYQVLFESFCDTSEKVANKYGNLTLKLSSLIGAVICIVLL